MIVLKTARELELMREAGRISAMALKVAGEHIKPGVSTKDIDTCLLYTSTQKDIALKGHAIECRINAENPAQGFRPCPGTIQALHMPGGPGVRIDSAIYQGYTITPYYDSMIAKLIVYAPTRKEAILKMRWALAEFLVEGVDTNIEFQLNLVKDPDFEAGNFDIGFLDRKNFTHR